MPTKINPDDILQAQAHVVGLLNQAEAILTGWVLKYDRDEIAALFDPLYARCDTNRPPSVQETRIVSRYVKEAPAQHKADELKGRGKNARVVWINDKTDAGDFHPWGVEVTE